MPSRTPEWERVRTIENILALLDEVDGHRRVIRAHAWREGDFAQIYIEATHMAKALHRLKAELSARWHELYDEATGEE